MKKYKSPLRKLAIFFEKSRDNWKLKYKASQKQVKSLQNKLYYLKITSEKQQQTIEALKRNKVEQARDLPSKK